MDEWMNEWMNEGMSVTERVSEWVSVPDLYEYFVCCGVCVSFIIFYTHGPYGIVQYSSPVLWQL